MAKDGITTKGQDAKPKISPETNRVLNIYHTLQYFNSSIYDYCRFQRITSEDERDYLLQCVVYIDKLYKEKK